MIKRVYIAAPFSERKNARILRDDLYAADDTITVTSRWLDTLLPVELDQAEMDLADIRDSEAIVFINPSEYADAGTGGRHVEVGYALAHGMPVILFGAECNVFHALPLVRVVKSFSQLMLMLLELSPVVSHEDALNGLIARVHRANRKWWHDADTDAPLTRNYGELLMLVVTELAESMEGDRKNLQDDKLPQYPMKTVEIADALIRLFDIAGGLSLDVAAAFESKMIYNATRVDHTHEHRRTMHGKKY